MLEIIKEGIRDFLDKKINLSSIVMSALCILFLYLTASGILPEILKNFNIIFGLVLILGITILTINAMNAVVQCALKWWDGRNISGD